MDPKLIPDNSDKLAWLDTCLKASMEENKLAKYEALKAKLHSGISDRAFFVQFSSISTKIGKAPLTTSPTSLEKLAQLAPGLDVTKWTCDQAARIWLLLKWAARLKRGDFLEKLTQIFQTADRGELVALYQGLMLLPYHTDLVKQTQEGIRTNITEVFDAIALENPFPAKYLDEAAWNQMVLKAAFMDRPIYRIKGIDERANQALAIIISDYAHERWAAGRVVSPEFWRPVTKFLSDILIKDIERLFEEKNLLHHCAGLLVCMDSQYPQARNMLEQHQELFKEIEASSYSWDQLAKDWWAQK